MYDTKALKYTRLRRALVEIIDIAKAMPYRPAGTLQKIVERATTALYPNTEPEYECRCHARMGNDFWFLPKRACLYGKCDKYDDAAWSTYIKTGLPPHEIARGPACNERKERERETT